MSTPVPLPALGESVTEGTVSRWLKKVGDSIELDEPLVEVSTDKVDTEIPAPAAGVLLQIMVNEDEVAPVGAVLALIGAADEADGDTAAPQEPSAQAAAPEPEPAAETETVDAQPADAAAAEPESASQAEAEAAEGVEVRLPQLGESVTEGTVSRWLKQVGDAVAADEPLVEVSTDKVDTEIPAPASGVLLQILVTEDAVAGVGSVLAVIGQAAAGSTVPAPPAAPAVPAVTTAPAGAVAPAGTAPSLPTAPPALPSAPTHAAMVTPADIPAPAPADPAPEPEEATPAASVPVDPAPAPPAVAEATEPAPATPAEPAPAEPAPAVTTAVAPRSTEGGDLYVTPLVRRMAQANGVDLHDVTGTGVGGRIRKQDILTAAEEKKAAAAAAAANPEAPAATDATVAAPVASVHAPASCAEAAKRGTTEKMTRLRATIARRMVESLQVSAQLTATVEVDLTAISKLRARAKDEFKAREGVGLSYLPFIAKVTVEALKQFPKVNATIDTEAGTISYADAEHLGIAVDTPKGLLVPVVKDAGDLSIAGLAKKIADLAARTRESKVMPDELSGGTFTITNYGSAGTLFDTPIVNQPQVAILGTGALVKRPMVVTDPSLGEIIAVRDMMYLSLSYDHRLVDGADAARFLNFVKTRLEESDFTAELGL